MKIADNNMKVKRNRTGKPSERRANVQENFASEENKKELNEMLKEKKAVKTNHRKYENTIKYEANVEGFLSFKEPKR